MELFAIIALIIICFLLGHLVGWESAHKTVAKECKVLGKFYVGKEVFECTKFKDIE